MSLLKEVSWLLLMVKVIGCGSNAAVPDPKVMVPLSKMAFVTAAVLTFAHTVGEFGVVLMVGGDIPGVTRTLSISIFDQVQEANYAGANRAAIWLVLLSFLALLAVYARGRGQGLGVRD